MILALLAASPTLFATLQEPTDRWPGWRGLDANGVAAGSPPLEWSEERNIRWKALLPGKGTSSPVVWGDRVFLTTAIPTAKKAESEDEAEPEQAPEGRRRSRGGFGGMRRAPLVEHEFVVLAFDRADGSEVWRKSAGTQTPHQGTHPDGSYASPTPVTDGEIVIASFGSYGIYAYTCDGEPLWQKDFGDMDIAGSFGEGSSPLLHGDTLVVNWDHSGDSFVVALDRKSGDEIWRRSRENMTTWVSPILIEGEDGPLVVIAAEKTIAYRLDTGEEVWSYDAAPAPVEPDEGDEHGDDEADDEEETRPRRPSGAFRRGGGAMPRAGVITTPVVHDGVLLYSTGSRRGSFRAIRVAGATGTLEAALWSSEGDTPHIPSPIAYGGILYSLKSNSGLLSAYDVATGERIYGPQRMVGLTDAYASPVAAAGHLFFIGRDGTSEVVAAGREFKSVAVNTLDEKIDASPAVAGDELFLRGTEHLYCIAKDG